MPKRRSSPHSRTPSSVGGAAAAKGVARFFGRPLLPHPPRAGIIHLLDTTGMTRTPPSRRGVFLLFRPGRKRAAMAESVVLVTEKREGSGTRKAAKLRKTNKVPAVIYGHKEATLS